MRAASLLGSEPAADKRQQQQTWIAEALGLLRRAIRLGYVNVKRMREDEDLAAAWPPGV